MRHRGVFFEFLEGGDETGRIPGELACADIGQRLAAPGDRGLHRFRDDRGHDQQREAHKCQRIAAVVVVAFRRAQCVAVEELLTQMNTFHITLRDGVLTEEWYSLFLVRPII